MHSVSCKVITDQHDLIDSDYVDIVVNSKARAITKPFTYKVPETFRGCLEIGHEVRIPFGKQLLTGFVIAPNYNGIPDAKEIIEITSSTPLVSQELIALAKWLGERYIATLWESIRTVLPAGAASGKKAKPKLVKEIESKMPIEKLGELAKTLAKRASLQSAFLSALQLKGGVALIHELPPLASRTLHNLVKQGVVTYKEIQIHRNSYVNLGLSQAKNITLNLLQEKACKIIRDMLDRRTLQREILLFGVTGSGKTEVYLESLSETLHRGKQAIVLVPEISLSCLVAERIKNRFGDRVAIVHSALNYGERTDEWQRIASGDVDIVIGARSALFAPLKQLGLIIIDEEHDGAYKQEQSPRYHARETARKRAELNNAILILGSATPSLESLVRTQKDESLLLRFNKRVDGSTLPIVNVIDLKEDHPMEGLFSSSLLKHIEEHLKLNQQIILFLNRRGFASTVLCRECGNSWRCPHCSVPLIFHSKKQSIHCHYCDYQEKAPAVCSNCKSFNLEYKGTGTEKAEDVLLTIFPGIKILRMDKDTTSKKGSHGEILQKFARQEASILIGTQMVAKGFDFPNVSLVGILNADIALNFPDFRSAERTVQLLIQVAGRAGRGNIPGKVILQTYSPNNPAIIASMTHNYELFVDNELQERTELGYPPATNLVRVIINGEESLGVESHIRELASLFISQNSEFTIIGPAPAPIERLRGKYRWHFLVKTPNPLSAGEIGKKIQYLWAMNVKNKKGISIAIDVDPLNLL